MANHVFITHAVENKKIANLVCEALESNGIKCWIAPRDVPYGMNFEEAIIDAICGSKLMILILSTHSNNSPHVKREIQNACMENAQTPILPFRVEDIRLNKALRYYLGSTQWLDASTPPLESHFENLINRVRVYLPPEAGVEAAGKAEAEAADKPAEAEALLRQQTEPAEEMALRQVAIQQPDRRTTEPVPFSGFEEPLERPNRRLLYISAGAMLAVAIIIVAAVVYIYNQNGESNSLATVPAEANSPRTDQPSGTAATNPPVNSNTVTNTAADPRGKPTPVPSPSTAVRPSPERTATSDEPQPSPTAKPRPPVSGGVLNDKAISLPKPAYPPMAATRASGTVVVQVLIDEDGNVVSANPVSGHPLLHGAAVRAARRARFSPTLISGERVKVSGVIHYDFVPAERPRPSSTTP